MSKPYTYAQLSHARDLDYLAYNASGASHHALSPVSFRNAARAHRDAADAYDALITGEPSQIAALASAMEKGRILREVLFELQGLKAAGLEFSDCIRVFNDPKDSLALLKALKAAGLTFNDCVTAFGTSDDPHLLAAREDFQKDGTLEFDETAVVSLSDSGGAYVMAWHWVDTPESSND